jgi:hypothetical protein
MRGQRSVQTTVAYQIVSSATLPQAAEASKFPLGGWVLFPVVSGMRPTEERFFFTGVRWTVLSLWLLASLFSMAKANANLLTNGDFEQPGSALTTNFVGVGSGTQITGWTTAIGNGSSPNVFYSNNGSSDPSIPNAESGTYCVQLASTKGTAFTTGSSINQTLHLNSGTYTLSFWINSTANGLPLNTSTIDYSITSAGLNLSNTATTQAAPLLPNKNQPWTQLTFTFTQSSNGNVRIAFTDDNSNGRTASRLTMSILRLPPLLRSTRTGLRLLFSESLV